MFCGELSTDLNVIQKKDLHNKICHSIEVVQKAISEYKIDEIALSFNGGKDCCVLLHLLHIVLSKLGTLSRLKVLYFSHPNAFGEVKGFVDKCAQLYGFQLTTLPPLSVHELQQQVDLFHLKAIFMGTRSTDPRCSALQDFSPTDPGWPPVMRVNPILLWTYEDVWEFILAMKVPYCELYDRGYTSIGSSTDTIPNPELKKHDGSHDPAFRLRDGTKERAGRLSG